MKKLLYSLLLIFSGISLFAQPHLRISNITGIPISPGDTVYEVNTYDSVFVTLVNEDTVTFVDTVYVLIQSDSLSGADTLVYDTGVSIQPGDSVILQRTGYVFSPVYFDDGDNIVVVWPMARLHTLTYDPIDFDIYYVSLIASVENTPNEPFFLYPNPATNYIAFQGLEGNKIKQVRIYDVSGKEIYRELYLQKFILIEDCKPGFYFIKLENEDESIRIIKFLKN